MRIRTNIDCKTSLQFTRNIQIRVPRQDQLGRELSTSSVGIWQGVPVHGLDNHKFNSQTFGLIEVAYLWESRVQWASNKLSLSSLGPNGAR